MAAVTEALQSGKARSGNAAECGGAAGQCDQVALLITLPLSRDFDARLG